MGRQDSTMRRAILSCRCAKSTFAAPRQRSFCAAAEMAAPQEGPGMTSTPPPQKVIDLAEQIVSLNLLEASQLNDIIKERLGISDVAMMPSVAAAPGAPGAPAAAAEEAEEEKTSFEVVLSGFDASSKIKVIKEIRGITNLGLKEAKELVENAPKTLKDSISKEEAEAIKEKVEAVGGKVELK